MAEGGGSAQIWVAVIGGVAAVATALIAAGAIKLGGPDKQPHPHSSHTPSAAATFAPTPTPTPTPISLDGKWLDVNKVEMVFTQSGDAVDTQANFTVNNAPVSYTGHGIVSGHSFSWQVNSSFGDAATCTTTISAAADRIQGDCRHNNNLVTPVSLTREP